MMQSHDAQKERTKRTSLETPREYTFSYESAAGRVTITTRNTQRNDNIEM